MAEFFPNQSSLSSSSPTISRSLTLNFIGDWDQANFHRICSWLAQEFCGRAGPRSRVAIWNVRAGGIEALELVHSGEAQLAIATPAPTMKYAVTGTARKAFPGEGGHGGLFPHPMPSLCALAVLPQNDRMVLAVDPKFGVRSFDDIRQKKPALRIATSADDGTSFISHVARRMMEAHRISEDTLRSWGGSYVRSTYRPDQSLVLALDSSQCDAALQEAIMTPWWRDVIEKRGLVPIPAEPDAIAKLASDEAVGLGSNPLPAGFWSTLHEELPALDFSDFVVVVRNDLPEDVAYLLTWCIVQTRETIERQYWHIPKEKSPLGYPLSPKKMVRTSLPLHPGAEKFYREKGYL